MVESAEKLIADLRASVSTLSQDVSSLSESPPNLSPAEFERRSRITAELITQALVKLDSLQISKDAAAIALRNGDRKTSRQLSVLLARRKIISKQLDQLGTVMDKITAQAASAVSSETAEKTQDNGNESGARAERIEEKPAENADDKL